MGITTRPALPVRWALICVVFPVYAIVSAGWALGVRVLGLEAFDVQGPSMEPTLLDGDRFVADKSAYGLALPMHDEAVSTWGAPEVGDVVVLRSPDGFDLIKRVVAIGGDRIAIDHDVVVRNGERIELRAVGTWDGGLGEEGQRFEERVGDRAWEIVRSPLSMPESMPEAVVPEGHVFVLGDHRDRSNDSRNPVIGMVPVSRLRGRVSHVYWSVGESGRARWARVGEAVR
ncbi:signal peptidase I [Sandaracinus amylolyticus]|uniref:signal peptidase I n=1 Tax=Sandaracinus amylolyticus TaxID=927083 RepID=UPI001F33E070|nr:signal peptidase I [Sandaracinus amylolyticus]UJR85391.1 Hypothetical protein I5071_74710 [Sandaracinus amylolyticus]